MNAPESRSLIGARVQRKEDYRFLTGTGQYTDDVALANQSYAVFVRSPHAHAVLKKLAEVGVLALDMGPRELRFVTHLDVSRAAVEEALVRIERALRV